MDPYRTFGVTRGCTRDEARQAFLLKAQHTHPDRGGYDLAFVELRGAYEQILSELDRSDLLAAKRRVRPLENNRPPTLFYPKITPKSSRERLRRVWKKIRPRRRRWTWHWSEILVILLILCIRLVGI
jgi:curved DNA-binding protein CbpA